MARGQGAIAGVSAGGTSPTGDDAGHQPSAAGHLRGTWGLVGFADNS